MVSHEKPGEGHGEPRRVMRARRPWDNKGGGEPGEPTKGPWVSQGPPGKEATQGGNSAGTKSRRESAQQSTEGFCPKW